MLKELFEQNRNIIINTDIDGILCGAILVKHLNCNIVGFTNSKDRVWLADDYDDLYSHVYVDMFVTDDRAICVDQHVVAVNASHQKKIVDSQTKYSPQIDGNRIFTDSDFVNKYPFGTVQYLIAQLESEGVPVSLPSMTSIVPDSSIRFGDLVQRADDAMKTTLCAYQRNAANWWRWLLEKSGNAPVTTELYTYLESIKQSVAQEGEQNGNGSFADRLKGRVEAIKSDTKKYFAENFSCRTGDGGFKDIVDENDNILDCFAHYVRTIGSLVGCNISLPSHYRVHRGVYCRTRWIDIFEDDFLKDYTICGHKVFSYAFIYGRSNDSTTNFSFTVDME